MNALDHPYLRLADLQRLRHLFFASRKPIVGQYAGRHASPQRGRSVEFADYRQYFPGDPLGDVDWKTYGRSNKLFVKLFEHQADMAVNLLLDASASMAYAGMKSVSRGPRAEGRNTKTQTATPRPQTSNPSKFSHAARLAAAITFLTTQQRDRVSFGLAQGGLQEFRPAGQAPNQLKGILDTMEKTDPAGESGLPAALRQMIGAIPRHGLLIVLSDLLDDQDQTLAALSLFTHRGGQAILFHVLHADELRLPVLADGGDAIFLDSEGPQRVTVNIGELRADYDARMKQFLQSWTTACARRGIDYNLVSTATPYQWPLEQYLYTRASRA